MKASRDVVEAEVGKSELQLKYTFDAGSSTSDVFWNMEG